MNLTLNLFHFKTKPAASHQYYSFLNPLAICAWWLLTCFQTAEFGREEDSSDTRGVPIESRFESVFALDLDLLAFGVVPLFDARQASL